MSVRPPGHEELLRQIAARASTLWERLDGPYVPEGDPKSTQLAAARLVRWRDKAAGGDAGLFQQRLAWLGITPQRALEVLGEVRLEGPLPSWTQTLEDALRAARPLGAQGRSDELPFHELVRPFAEVGVARLSPGCRASFTPEALEMLAGDLLRELSYISAPTFLLECMEFRTRQAGTATQPPGRRLYETWADSLLRGELWSFFSEYAALARLLATSVEMWVRGTSELAEALQADRPQLQYTFSGGAPLGRIAAIHSSLSDKHDGGRTVARVEFESGLRLFYKPRSLGVEQAWYGLLQHLNARGGDFLFLRVMDRGTRGWVQPVLPAPCGGASEARQFYLRSGMLLALFYTLGSSDCFYENIIASGAHPVLIDMETLLHPALSRGEEQVLAEGASQELPRDCVLRAGFLPCWQVGPGGECVDISGLCATAGQVTSYLKRRWRHVNTDAMALEHEPIKVEAEHHLPRLEGVALRASEYTEEVVEGFQRMYRLLVRQREELCAPEGPLAALGTQAIRLIFQPTRVYSLILKRLYSPRHMRHGVERSIEMDLLSRFYLESRERARHWPILAAELQALERLDIPYFQVRADSHCLSLPTGVRLEHAIEESGLEQVQRRLSSLSEADLALQSSFIRAALSTAGGPRSPRLGVQTAQAAEVPLLSKEELIAEAASIATRLEQQALALPGGGLTWLTLQLHPQVNHQPLRPLRLDLYGGLAGLALFFSALEHVSGRGRSTALAALSSLRSFVSQGNTPRAAQEGYTLGATTGVGSFLYTLCRCAALLDEPALLGEAAKAASLITPESIKADEELDIMAGAAGALLGLLALHEATGDSQALDKALLCGEHLLEHQQPTGQGGKAWRMKRGGFKAGFAHGAAGITLALLRLHAATGEARFRGAAEEAMTFEDSTATQGTWCHGAVGIGLARVSGLALLDSAGVQRDIAAAIAVASQQELSEKDGMCCGNLGRTDLLLVAAKARGDTQLESLALRLASEVVGRARLHGYSSSDPAFFQGLSGIGYQFLRIARPERLSSILTL